MPAEQPLVGQRLRRIVCVASSIISTTPSTLRSAGVKRADVDAEAAGDRGAHLVAVENLAFDLARLEDVLGQRFEIGLGLQPEAESLHPADQPSLPVADRRQLSGQRVVVPWKWGQSGRSWM